MTLKAPSSVFLVIGTLAGLVFLLTTPPLRFPDEVGHYLRTANVAGWLLDRPVDAPDSALMPPALADDLDYFASRAPEIGHGRPFDVREVTSRIKLLDRLDIDLVDRPAPAGQMVYLGIGYFPQAVGFAIARFAGASFVPTLWAARLGVLLTSVLITAVALELMPFGARWTSAAVSLIPMAAYLRGSSSPDGVVTAVTLLGVAALLDGAKRNDVPWSSSVVALAACLYLAAVKPPYACILLLSLFWLPLGHRKHLQPRVVTSIVCLMWIATLIVTVWHSEHVASFAARLRPDVTPAEIAVGDKLHMLLTSPLAAGAIFAKTLLAAPGMAYSTIARFGWGDINPHPILHGLVVGWCVAVIYLDRRAILADVSWKCGAVMLATFAVQVVLVVLSIWLYWTETKSPMVQSVQGRHFLPALACGVLGVATLVLRSVASRSVVELKVNGLLLSRFVTMGAATLLGLSLIFAVLGEFFGVKTFHVICLHELCKPD